VRNPTMGRATLVAGLFAVALLCGADAAPPQTAATPGMAFENVVLTQTQMDGFVAALPEVVGASMRKASGASDAEVQTALTAVFNAHGFSTPEEYVVVSSIVALVMSGIDPQTMEFTEPKLLLEDRIESVTRLIDRLKGDLESEPAPASPTDIAAKLLPLTQMLDQMKGARKSLLTTTNPGNVELVKRYFDRILLSAKASVTPR
jgi:hypothetical protein